MGAEKKKWQAERRAGRGAAIEKMREDRQKEAEMEQLKREDPQAYKQLLKEQEEARRSFEELKKRKRLMAAAEERKRKAEMGETDEEPEEEDKQAKRRRKLKREPQTSSWLKYALGACGLAF